MLSTRNPTAKRAAFTPVAFEHLESRLVLSVALADWYPLNDGQRWDFAGTSVGEPLGFPMVSGAGIRVGNQTTTAFHMQGGPLAEESYLKMSPAGLRLVRHGIEIRYYWQAATFASGGIVLLPPQVELGQVYAHSGTFTGATYDYGDEMFVGPTQSQPMSGSITGTVTLTGEEPLSTIPGLRFQTLRMTRQDRMLVQGNGWSATTTLTLTNWLAKGLGIVRMDMQQLDEYSSGQVHSTSYSLSLVKASMLPALVGMQVSGKGVAIANQDLSPDSADGTDFGSLDVNGETKTRMFKITNNSAQTLRLGATGLWGGDAASFTILRTPDASLAPGGSTFVSVRFDPAAAGSHNTKLIIRSSDPTANPYTFAVRGTGVAYGVINVRRIDKSVWIAAGDTTPSLAEGTSIGRTIAAGNEFIERTFLISNTGLGDLTLTGHRVSITLGNVSRVTPLDFMIMSQPDAVIAPGGSTTFTIRFDPSNVGPISRRVLITSSDRFVPDFRFDILGTGK